MRGIKSKVLGVAAGLALVAAALPLQAQARVHHHHRFHHHHRYWDDRPLTVTRHRQPMPVAEAPDPFHGPAAIVTGPNAVAATIVSLPFRAVNAVFPPYGNPATNPLVLIGGPVYAAAHVAEMPFYVVGSAFGAPPRIVY